MDAETRAYLDEALGAVRRDFAGLRGEFTELRGEVGGLRGEVSELRTEVRETAVETRRHFDVTAEALRHDVQTVAEGVAMTNERVDRFGTELRAEMNERFTAQEAMMRIAFRDVRRDIEDLRARL